MKVNLRIAPGENNFSISLLFYERAEEFSFPQICLNSNNYYYYKIFRIQNKPSTFVLRKRKHSN